MPYDPAYFQNQIDKSDAKVEWQYGRLLRFSGLAARPNLRVLDAGCGAGPGLRFLVTRGYHAFGTDFVQYPLDVARRVAPEARLALHDLTRGIPFVDNSFDVILLSEVIEHVPDPLALLRECWRVLDHGGVVVATTPNLWDVRRFIFPLTGRVWSGYADPTHRQLFNPRTLHHALSEAGFRRIVVAAGFKPLVWLSSQKLRMRAAVPWPPLVGNTLCARGVKDQA